jgi:hypothetical protein
MLGVREALGVLEVLPGGHGIHALQAVGDAEVGADRGLEGEAGLELGDRLVAVTGFDEDARFLEGGDGLLVILRRGLGMRGARHGEDECPEDEACAQAST